MQVIDATEMARIEKLAIEEGASGDAFMQTAAKSIFERLSLLADQKSIPKKVVFLAGQGNNGGDAFCVAHLLLDAGFEVLGYQVGDLDKSSELCQKYGKAFSNKGGRLIALRESEDFKIPSQGFLLDGLLGTGFHGHPKPMYLELFQRINASTATKVSIDIPSGLNGNTGEVFEGAVVADYTCFLGLPKTGFFVREGWNHVGQLFHCDFGLDIQYLTQAKPQFELLEKESLKALFPPILRNRHKYQSGFVVGLSGSKGMLGASMLSGMAALRAGAGMVKVIHLEDEPIFSSVYPELIHLNYSSKQHSEILDLMNQANCVYIGPGLGQSKKVQGLLQQLLPQIKVPCVLDADALNLIATHKWGFPKETLLTPHIGEMHRLLGKKTKDSHDLISLCQKYAEQSGVTLVLKGGPTFIFSRGHLPRISPFGDPGMATAGAGDVLTGVLSALWAQPNMDALKSAYLGCALHGLVGQYGASRKSSYSLVASDLVKYLYKAFNFELLTKGQ